MAYVSGITTGLDHKVGTRTVDGATTKEVTATETIFELGIDATTTVGTNVGTFSYEMTTIDGYDGIV